MRLSSSDSVVRQIGLSWVYIENICSWNRWFFSSTSTEPLIMNILLAKFWRRPLRRVIYTTHPPDRGVNSVVQETWSVGRGILEPAEAGVRSNRLGPLGRGWLEGVSSARTCFSGSISKYASQLEIVRWNLANGDRCLKYKVGVDGCCRCGWCLWV